MLWCFVTYTGVSLVANSRLRQEYKQIGQKRGGRIRLADFVRGTNGAHPVKTISSQSRECMGSYQEASVNNGVCDLIVIGKNEVKVRGFYWLRYSKAIGHFGL